MVSPACLALSGVGKTFGSGAAQTEALGEGWVRAYQKGVDWVNQNLKSEELYGIISGYTRMPPPLIAKLGVTAYEKAVDPAALVPVVDQMRRNGLLEGDFDPKSILHRTALKA